MVYTSPRTLVLAFLLWLTTSQPAQAAETASLVLGTATQNQQSVVVYTAQALPSTDTPAEAIFSAALLVLSAYYETTRPTDTAPASWPETLAINGIILDIQSARPTPKPSSATSQRTMVSTTARPKSTISSIRSSSRLTTTSALSSSMSSKTSSTTHTSTTTHRSSSTPSAVPNDDSNKNSSDVDRIAAIVVGTILIFIALAFMLFLIGMVFRRKKSTGRFSKPARYSVASMMTGTLRGGTSDRASRRVPTPTAVRTLNEANEKALASEDGRINNDAACPAPLIARNSTIRPVTESPASSTWSSRRSVERFRTKHLVSQGQWRDSPHELPGVESAHELDATPITPGGISRQPSFSSSDADDFTPTPTPAPFYRDESPQPHSMVVIHSPTTSSSGFRDSESRHLTSSSGRGESRDAITPIVTPVASYRDRRPANLTLSGANNRFRDQRLVPMVHYHDDSPDGVSPLYRGRVSPLYRRKSSSPSPGYGANGGYSPSPSPGTEGGCRL
ncbi:hypothetical protein CLAFUW4_00220 [Fulvia fulva]|uniref:Uncharacterized protein n=1 Tax=Passalora fulva TaxID=5499 RepID=A0A9Q8L8U6_PASFU|nr:uncharacterized protein CLAFUR5_00220 [Fulvia fulva]KAK4634477.1 hypothetical protein CLAFUR4_00220 [Fulvia fulva]KAK4637054.1 hypothetical protein CLAFUR0_00221 [Fulvia fulva]UJO12834.1 hypothetical protein CLAFUR5_00220 [Fulvia fulva]WPV08456.1 hypothetical protein CLAFUW4_00220 [Fulvia fulva]WPV24915.1 hypothetical protein CLAFUW7_00223 [Fulvia fulva]